MQINITESQLELANWLLEQFNSGVLNEQFSVKWKLKNYIPATGKIIDFDGDQPEITFASLAALEKANLILTVHKKIKSAKRGGTKGGSFYQMGYPRHETMRVFTLLGDIHHINEKKDIRSRELSTLTHSKDNVKFVSQNIIDQLKEIDNTSFDVSRLTKYCEETNDNFTRENYSSVVFLSRAILDHCPPVFGQKNF